MAVTIGAAEQRHAQSPEYYGTATAYSETVTATGALDVLVPASIVNVNGTATTVLSSYTLGTGPYEGFKKHIITGQGAATASDSLGVVQVELVSTNTVGATASTVNMIQMRHPGNVECTWINDRWSVLPGLNVQVPGPVMGTATTNMMYESSSATAGALDPKIPVSVIKIPGTATTVNHAYTLGTGPYDGFFKTVIMGQGAATASDSLGVVNLEVGALASGEAEYDQMVWNAEFGDALLMQWADGHWNMWGSLSLATGATMGTATT